MYPRKLNFLECLVRKRQVRGLRSSENHESVRMIGFMNEHNDEIGVFGQALLIRALQTMEYLP